MELSTINFLNVFTSPLTQCELNLIPFVSSASCDRVSESNAIPHCGIPRYLIKDF